MVVEKNIHFRGEGNKNDDERGAETLKTARAEVEKGTLTTTVWKEGMTWPSSRTAFIYEVGSMLIHECPFGTLECK